MTGRPTAAGWLARAAGSCVTPGAPADPAVGPGRMTRTAALSIAPAGVEGAVRGGDSDARGRRGQRAARPILY